MSEGATGYVAEAPLPGTRATLDYAFEQLTPAEPPSRDMLAELVAQAETQAAEIRARAREGGYAEGRAAGYSDGLANTTSAAQALSDALSGVLALREETALVVERDAIELAVTLAEKILSGALQAKPELIVEVAQGALRRVGDSRRVTLLINPSDVEAVAAALGSGSGPFDSAAERSDGAAAGSGGVSIEGDSRARAKSASLRARTREGQPCDVQADPGVPRGGAIVRTEEGEVDAGVGTQLERARELMLAELGV